MSDKQIIPVIEQETCSHPELIGMRERYGLDMSYQCSACGKKIIIPATTLVEHGATSLANIIALAFSEVWDKKLRGGA